MIAELTVELSSFNKLIKNWDKAEEQTMVLNRFSFSYA